jgi:hypothetical protein
MSALQLVPTVPEPSRRSTGVTPIRRLAAVPDTVSPPARPPLAVVPATPSPASPATPNGSAAGGRPLKPVGENGEICAITRGTVQAAIEVLAGTRPVYQLSRRLDQRCLASLQHRAALTRRLVTGTSPTAGRLHRNPAVRSVRACEVAAGIYEASAVVVDELRVRAVAVRLERCNQAWRVTALEIG